VTFVTVRPRSSSIFVLMDGGEIRVFEEFAARLEDGIQWVRKATAGKQPLGEVGRGLRDESAESDANDIALSGAVAADR